MSTPPPLRWAIVGASDIAATQLLPAMRRIGHEPVAVVSSDVPTDCWPYGNETLGLPVHTVGLWAIGLWLVDNCDLEALSRHCARTGRYEFFYSIAPLLLPQGTGSPVTPLAIF